jgi:hypothetical protein
VVEGSKVGKKQKKVMYDLMGHEQEDRPTADEVIDYEWFKKI